MTLAEMPSREIEVAPAPYVPAPGEVLNFDADPQLRDLLHPDVVIRPGITYLACSLMNLQRAEAAGFRVMPNQRSFSVRGVPCMVMTRGTAVPGGRAESQLVQLRLDVACDRSVGSSDQTVRSVAPDTRVVPNVNVNDAVAALRAQQERAGIGQHDPDASEARENTPPGPAPVKRPSR